MMTRKPRRRFLELLTKVQNGSKLPRVCNRLQKCPPKFTEKERSNSCSAYSYSGIGSIERNLSSNGPQESKREIFENVEHDRVTLTGRR